MNGRSETEQRRDGPETVDDYGVVATLATTVRDLNPVYFALVMATGIVSLAAHRLNMPRVALALFGVNVIAYAILSVLTGIRLIQFPHIFLEDVLDYDHGLGLLTIVAGTCVFGIDILHTAKAVGFLRWGLVGH